MNTSHYIFINKYYAICLSLSVFVLPFFAAAEAQVFSETESQIYSSSAVSGGGNATVEIIHTSIINGEETSYYYSSSSPEKIEHSVRIENGIVIPNPEESDAIQMPNQNFINSELYLASATHSVSNQERLAYEIQLLWDAINYLSWYVKNIF